MSDDSASIFKTIGNLKLVIGLLVTVGTLVAGGTAYVNHTGGRIDDLTEKLEIQKGEHNNLQSTLAATENELRKTQCELHYTVQAQLAEKERDRTIGFQDSVRDLLPSREDTRPSAAERLRAGQQQIELLEKAICSLNYRMDCLELLEQQCEEKTDIDLRACRLQKFVNDECRNPS